jgi:hypothetical protein
MKGAEVGRRWRLATTGGGKEPADRGLADGARARRGASGVRWRRRSVGILVHLDRWCRDLRRGGRRRAVTRHHLGDERAGVAPLVGSITRYLGGAIELLVSEPTAHLIERHGPHDRRSARHPDHPRRLVPDRITHHAASTKGPDGKPPRPEPKAPRHQKVHGLRSRAHARSPWTPRSPPVDGDQRAARSPMMIAIATTRAARVATSQAKRVWPLRAIQRRRRAAGSSGTACTRSPRR